MVRETTYTDPKQPPDLIICGLKVWSGMSRAASEERKARLGCGETKARQCWEKLRGIYFIDPEDGEYKETH